MRFDTAWVETVNVDSQKGWSNFGAQIVMGKDTSDELLVHEIGHAFSLKHIISFDNFNEENIMSNASNTRQYVTEGQLFRSHLNPNSILNVLYNARPGEFTLTRTCDDSVMATPICPAIQKRIWADGRFPPN